MKFQVVFYRREPQIGGAIIEADTVEEAKRLANIAAIREEFPPEMDWEIDTMRRASYSVHKVRPVKAAATS